MKSFKELTNTAMNKVKNNTRSDRLVVLRLLLLGLSMLMGQLVLNLFRNFRRLEVVFSLETQVVWLLGGFLIIGVALFAAFLLTWTPYRTWLLSLAGRFVTFVPKSQPVVLFLLIIVIGIFSLVMILPDGEEFGLASFRWQIFGWVVILVMVLLRQLMPATSWLNVLAVAVLSLGFGYRLFQFLPDISTYPFSLGWSEGSRFYYASLFFSEKIYGFWIPPSTLHPNRYLMQAIPFLIQELPLWFHRVWQVFLWLACIMGTGFLLARRLKLTGRVWWALFLAWIFIFIWQGPVYYHLLVILMIVLWGFDPKHFWRSLIVVVVASIWAGISRVNWFPVPGMLATLLYFLESSGNERPTWKVLFPPVVWVLVGMVTALVAQSIYILWSGNDPEFFTSSFSSALLWYRLFPNATYSLGLLTGSFLISTPIFILLWVRVWKRENPLSFISWLAVIAILLVFLIGGLVVSVKIGGGSNLHNIDAYLALLMVVGSYFYFDRFQGLKTAGQFKSPAWLNLAIVFLPVFISMGTNAQMFRFHPQTTADTLFKMQQNISRALETEGEILFISERQLITFDYLEGVPLVPEYEKVFLMEMVMARNQDFLDAFEKDIRQQRFDLIITDPLFDTYKELGDEWAEENNVWAESVSVPLLCHYFRKVTFPEAGVQILAPRKDSLDCSTLLVPTQ